MVTRNQTSSAGREKYSKESPFAIATSGGVMCRICPNDCLLKEGQYGLCLTHTVKNGKLCFIAFGNPCSVHTDPIEKKPLFHFLPASLSFSVTTAGCNFSCLNCQNWEISQTSPHDIREIEMFPEKIVVEAIRNGCKSIAYTYGEPVVFYEYALETARQAKVRGIKNLLISNGFINEKPLRELIKSIDAANIDIKSFSENIYSKLNGGSLKPILETLKILNAEGIWLEITNLIIPGWTDDTTMIREMCEWLVTNGFADNPLHFSRFYPSYRLKNIPATPLATMEKAREIALKTGIRYVYIGNVPGSGAESTHCPTCHETLIERRGFDVLINKLNHGMCKFCHTKIAGIWE